MAIATVADVVPLTGENRIIVKHGLRGLRSVRNPGLRALLDVAGFTRAPCPRRTQVAFQHRAAHQRRRPHGHRQGRDRDVPHRRPGERARELAEQLHDQNTERQQVEAETVESCLRMPFEDEPGALVYYGEDWHRGVLGIVASRLVERFHRPVFVLSRSEDGLAQGSGRSIPAFHLLEALESMADLFVKFGGHTHAAGVTLRADRRGRVPRPLQRVRAVQTGAEDFLPRLEIDALIDFAEIDDRSVAEIFRLAPFGCGNPAPLFAALNVEVLAPPAIWKEKHLRLAIRQNGRNMSLKAWNFAERAGELAPRMRIDAAFTFEEDSYSAAQNGQPWGAVLRNFRPAILQRP